MLNMADFWPAQNAVRPLYWLATKLSVRTAPAGARLQALMGSISNGTDGWAKYPRGALTALDGLA